MFHPDTSHDILRFASVRRHWIDAQPQPPISVGIVVDPDECAVWWASCSAIMKQVMLLLLTREAEEAVRLAESLLDRWPYPHPIRPLRAAAQQPIFWVE